MTEEAAVAVCANCGAPLKLDSDDRCVFCRAQVVVGRPLLPTPSDRIVAALDALKDEPAVRKVVDAQLLEEPIGALAAATVAAGQRVVREGVMVGDTLDIRVFKPAELWTFNLAADVIFMLDGVDNLSKVKRAEVREVLADIDANLSPPWCRSTIAQARPGPAEFQALRGLIPPRRWTKF